MIRSGGGRVLATAVFLGVAMTVVAVIAVRASHRTEGPPAASPSSSTEPRAPASPTPTARAEPSGCRAGDPLVNVYHPVRLRVLAACKTATGIVAIARVEADGDIHLNIALDPGQESLLARANRTKQSGDLVAEIVPADRPGCVAGAIARPRSGTRDFGLCTGAAIGTPLTGRRIRVTGPWVTDTIHGWNEIHPVWRLDLLAG